jgi:putative zinc finger/helix-turn-helix YgiT family protein
MSEIKCPVCGVGELKKVNAEYETRFVDDLGRERELTVRGVEQDQCSECGEVFLDDEATQKIESARLNAMRRLSPIDIRAFRERLGRTQSQMAALLGLGEKTYTRWESGAYIPNAASDRYLRLLMVNDANIAILEQLAGESKGPDLTVEPTNLAVFRVQFTAITQSESLLDADSRFTEMLTSGRTFLPC